MTDFSRCVSAFAKAEGLWQAGQRILVACSGGPDSLALAHWLIHIQKTAQIEVALAYVHHHLRAAADEELVFVRTFAEKEGVPFFGAECDVPEAAHRTGQSIETAAREERYRLLREIMHKEGYNLLAVAHHADDQAETVLHHVLRGTGLQGLRGMLPKSGDVIRPFLRVTRCDIMQYLTTVPYTPRIDESNMDTRYLRNALRHRVLPLLAEYNPQIGNALCRLADMARHDFDGLRYWAQCEVKGRWEMIPGQGRQIRRHVWARWPVAVRRQCIRDAYAVYGRIPGYGMVKEMAALIDGGRTGSVYCAQGVKMTLTATHIRFIPLTEEVPLQMEALPDESGVMVLDQVSIRLEVSRTAGERSLPQTAMQGMLRLRRRLPGDRIRLSYGTQKWKEWLINHKIPREERDGLVLLADDRHVYCAYTPQGKQLVRAVPPQGVGPYWVPMERRRK